VGVDVQGQAPLQLVRRRSRQDRSRPTARQTRRQLLLVVVVFVFGPAYGKLRRLNGVGRGQRAVEFDRDLRLVVICLVVVSTNVSGYYSSVVSSG
jgi:hypothetical protein